MNPKKPIVIAAWTSTNNVGKTSLLFLLAWWYTVVKGLKVKVWCADPEHESMSSWLNRLQDEQLNAEPRFGPPPFAYDTAPPPGQMWRKINHDIQDNDYDFVILDIGGGHEKIAKEALRHCDLMIMIANESLLEDEKLDSAIHAINKSVDEYGRGDEVEVALMLSRTAPNAKHILTKIQDKYIKQDIAVFDNAFPFRKAYVHLGRRHPDQVGIEFTPDTPDIAAIAGEIDELMERD